MRTNRGIAHAIALALVATSAIGAMAQSPAPSSASSIALPDSGDLRAGTTYHWDGEAWGMGSPRLIFTVPATGWSARNPGIFGKDTTTDPLDWHEILMTAWNVSNLMVDPCHWLSGGAFDPPVGPTVDDLATALVEQAGENAATPTDVTVGGYPGKRVELSLPAALDIASCESGEFWRWSESTSSARGGWIYSNGQRNIVYILDAGGVRVLIDTVYMPGTSGADLAEVEELVASMRFESPSLSPSPST